MRGPRPGWIVFAVFAASLGAEEKPAPAAPAAADNPSAPPPLRSSAPPPAPIEAARRQFELLKSARDAGPAAKPRLPDISMPELHSAPPESLPKSTTLKPEAGPKSGNWLVDAMEKGSDGRKDRDRREGRRENEGKFTRGMEKHGGEESETAAEGGPERAWRDKEEEPGALNPLAPFLAQWMTPQDYALLGASIERNTGPGEFPLRTGAPATAGGIEFGAGTTPRDVSGTSGGPKPIFTKPPENPYLQGLNMPVVMPAPPSASSPTMMPAPATAPPAYSAPTTPVSPRPKVPDFAKPQTDEKYFKPLKRF